MAMSKKANVHSISGGGKSNAASYSRHNPTAETMKMLVQGGSVLGGYLVGDIVGTLVQSKFGSTATNAVGPYYGMLATAAIAAGGLVGGAYLKGYLKDVLMSMGLGAGVAVVGKFIAQKLYPTLGLAGFSSINPRFTSGYKNNVRHMRAAALERQASIHVFIMGDQVELVKDRSDGMSEGIRFHEIDARGKEDVLLLPAVGIQTGGMVLAYDATGEFFRKCDVYVAPFQLDKRVKEDDIPDLERGLAQKTYWGLKLHYGYVAVPRAGWRPLARVNRIRYRRERNKDPLEHKYVDGEGNPTTVQAYQNSHGAGRLPLPSDCVINAPGWIGFGALHSRWE